jgi:integrase
MADIRKRTGAKGTTYQVRYPSNTTKSGYTYATFNTLKEGTRFSGKRIVTEKRTCAVW